MKAMVEPLPLVPATWITGGSRRSRVAELGEQPLDAAERQVDRLRMQGEKARDQRVGGLHRSGQPVRLDARLFAGCGQRRVRAVSAARAPSSRGRQRRAMVALRSCRCTT